MDAVRNGAMSSEGAPLVVCVVVNWNGWRDTVACVESVAAQDYPSLQILVVDNGSTDDSVQQIQAAFPQIELLHAEQNRGFAAGSNVGIRCALKRGAAFVWLLNNDTTAPSDTLSRLMDAAEERVGMVGTVLRYMHDPTKIQAWGGGSVSRWSGFVRHFRAPERLNENSYLTFASVLLRREMLETAGLLDEGYFMYFEDSDLSFRARGAGWQIAVAADTAVLHKEGGSAGSRKSTRVDRIVTASGLRFLKRYGRPGATAQVVFVLSRLGKRAVRGNLTGMGAVLRGVRDWRRGEPMAFREEP